MNYANLGFFFRGNLFYLFIQKSENNISYMMKQREKVSKTGVTNVCACQINKLEDRQKIRSRLELQKKNIVYCWISLLNNYNNYKSLTYALVKNRLPSVVTATLWRLLFSVRLKNFKIHTNNFFFLKKHNYSEFSPCRTHNAAVECNSWINVPAS